MTEVIQPESVTTSRPPAGGAGSRLGGADKAWLQRGVPQVLQLAKRSSGETTSVLVSANRDFPRYAESA